MTTTVPLTGSASGTAARPPWTDRPDLRRRRHRPARPERRRQDDPAAHPRHRARPRRGPLTCSAATPDTPRRLLRSPPAGLPPAGDRASTGFTGFGFVDYMAVLKEMDRPPQPPRRGAPGAGPCRPRRRRHQARARPVRWPCDDGSRSPRPCSATPSCCCSTSRPPASTPQQRVSLRGVLSRPGNARRCCCPPTRPRTWPPCASRVVVLDQGRVRFDGAVRDLVATAAGRVWLADAPDLAARASWRTGTGKHRHVGDVAPPGAEQAEPTLEDAYLLLIGDRARTTGVAA